MVVAAAPFGKHAGLSSVWDPGCFYFGQHLPALTFSTIWIGERPMLCAVSFCFGQCSNHTNHKWDSGIKTASVIMPCSCPAGFLTLIFG